MEHDRERLVGHCRRLVTGLVVCAVGAVTLHADVAAAAILTAVMLVVLAMLSSMLRAGDL